MLQRQTAYVRSRRVSCSNSLCSSLNTLMREVMWNEVGTARVCTDDDVQNELLANT